MGVTRATGRAIALTIGLVAGPAAPQDAPPGALVRPGPATLPAPAPAAPDDGFRLPDVPEAAPDAALSAGPQVFISAVEIEGATVFTAEDFAAVTADYTGRAVFGSELNTLRDALTRLYIDAGYVNSGAILPDQQIVDGVVRYEIIEGALTEIVIADDPRIREFYIVSRLRRAAGTPLNVNALREGVARLIDDPAIAGVSAELGPGARPGEAILGVRVTDAPMLDYDVTFDNASAPAVGAFQWTHSATLRNALGFGEALSVQVTETKGVSSHAVSLSAPLTPWDTRARFTFETTEAAIVLDPGATAEIESEARLYEFEISQPLYRDRALQLEIGGQLSHRKTQTFVLDRPFGLVAGVNPDTGVTRSSKTSLYLQGLWRSETHALVARLTGSHGLPIWGGAVIDGAPSTTAFIGVAQARAAWRPFSAYGAALTARIDAQFAGQALQPLEQLAAGGQSTVRGYRENAVLNDNGVIASAEARLPLLDFETPLGGGESLDSRLSLATFVDFAHLWATDRGVGEPETDQLFSVGGGVRMEFGPQITGFLYGAKRLRAPSVSGSGDLQDTGVHFSVTVKPVDAAAALWEAWGD